MPKIHILARKNGVGIDRDVRLLQRELASLGEVSWKDGRRTEPWHSRLTGRWIQSAAHAEPGLYVLTERLPRSSCCLPGPLVLVPNQERFPRRQLKRLRHIDRVLCKTRHAEEIFKRYTPRVSYIGFTSEDRKLSDVQPDYDRFFHLAGKSALKGTETLIDVWSRHPEWPLLTIVKSGGKQPKVSAGNIELINRYLEDAALRQLQNECGVHLCPSLSEGWGHYLVEAMSCGAVVVTTDGPPMNEIVQPEHGVLVPWHRSEPRHLGTNWHVDPTALEKAISQILHFSKPDKRQMGGAARAWFEQNDQRFGRRIREIVRPILDSQPQIKHVPLLPLPALQNAEHSVVHQGTIR